jgi:hypothetical protein
MRIPRLRLVEIMQINGVKVFVHWSVLLIGALILLGAVEDPRLAFTVLAAYYGVILLHECGHMVAAQRKGCLVTSIELYPIWGITCFSEPYSRYDLYVIAWGGVLAQATVAIPLIAWVELFGFTRFAPVNALLSIMGFFSLSMAAFNLLPIRPAAPSRGVSSPPSLSVDRRIPPNVRTPGDPGAENDVQREPKWPLVPQAKRIVRRFSWLAGLRGLHIDDAYYSN